jgi:predicted Na+-dependent transporter
MPLEIPQRKLTYASRNAWLNFRAGAFSFVFPIFFSATRFQPRVLTVVSRNVFHLAVSICNELSVTLSPTPPSPLALPDSPSLSLCLGFTPLPLPLCFRRYGHQVRRLRRSQAVCLVFCTSIKNISRVCALSVSISRVCVRARETE